MLAAARSSSSSGARKRLPPGVATLVIGVATLVAAIAFVLFPLGCASASGQPGRGSAVS
jgi:hypothetical protein